MARTRDEWLEIIRRDYSHLSEGEHEDLADHILKTHSDHKIRLAPLEPDRVCFWLRRIFWALLALIFATVLAPHLHAQNGTSRIDVITFQDNASLPVGSVVAPFIIKAGSNCSLAKVNSIVTFNCTGGAAAAGGSNTQVQFNNATALGGISTFTTTGTVNTAQAGLNWFFTDTTDTSKKFRFDVSNLSTATTRIVNIPDANSTTVQADTGAANNFLTAISAQGLISKARPACANLSDAGAFCNGTAYSSLTGVPALPANTTATASNFFTAYNSTTGAFTKAQPAFGDLSGSATTAQLPGTGATTVNGATCTLGSTCTVADSTKVPTTRTVNGKALSADITLGLASSDFANQGTTTTVLHGNGAGNPSFGGIVIADITDKLGTGTKVATTSATAPAAQKCVEMDTNGNIVIAASNAACGSGGSGMTNPMTTLGDIIYEDVTPTAARLAGNTTTTKQYLSQTGTGSVSAVPVWSQPAFSELSGSATTAQLPGTGATTVNGVACTLGSTCTVADSTKVPTTTTVNGHALSTNVTVSAPDVGLGSVTNDAQTKNSIVPNSFAGLRFGNSGTIDTAATSAQVQTVIGAGVYDASGAAAAKVGSVSGTANELASTGGTTPVLSIASAFDIHGKTSTAPIKAGTTAAAPATCQANIELYIKTDATAGQQVFICNATGNGWNLVGDGGAGGGVTSSTLTTGTIPKATGAAAIGDSSITDNGTTVATPEPIVVGTANVTAFGTAGGFGLGEGTAPTNVASTTACYPDSTSHEMQCATAGSSTFGILNRTAGAVNLTGKTATQSISTACAASAGACNVAGQYELNYNFWGSGTACSSVTAGKVVLTFTWTDENGTAHSAIPAPILFDQKAAASNVTGTFSFNTALGTEGAYGTMPISTNGAAAIQYTATYTACTTGTGTYNLRIATTRLQ